MTRPLVCVLERNNLFAWPPTRKPDGALTIPEGEDSVAYLPLAEALRCDAPSDLHLVQYSVPERPHRLSEGALRELPDGVPLQLLIADVDCPKRMRAEGRASEDWWAVELVKIQRLQAEQPGVLAYRSRGGYRLLAWLAEPHVVRDAETARQWRQLYLLLVADLHARYGIRADPKCGDWQHLQRAPMALRAGEREPGVFLGDPDNVGEWDTASLDPERATASARSMAETSKPWEQAIRVLEGWEEPTENSSTAEAPAFAGQLADLLGALVGPVSEIGENGGRHDLYLALSGVLHDRGVQADDLVDLINRLSIEAGVDDARLVADRVKTARSTIARAARGEPYRNIGTLARDYPAVARALDAVLPSPRDPRLEALFGVFVKAPPPRVELPPLVEGSDLEAARIAIHALRAEGAELVHDRAETWVCAPGEAVWEPRGDALLETAIYEIDGAPYGKKEVYRVNLPRVRGMQAIAANILSSDGFFDDAPAGCAFQNGLYLSGRLEPLEPRHRVTSVLPIPLDFDARCDEWLRALGEIFRDDADGADKIELLGQYVGCSLLGVVTQWQRCLVLEGASGDNGKSTVIEVITALFPGNLSRSLPPQRWGSDYHVAQLAGARMNLVAEMPRTDIEHSEIFKSVISGDRVNGRHPTQRPFEFRPRAGHVFACNELPGTSDQTSAYWKRFVPIGFNRRFAVEEQVKDLASRLIAAELPGIAAWAVRAAERALGAGRLTIPESSTTRLLEWRRTSNQVALWVGEKTESDESSTILTSQAFKNFSDWARDSGHKGMSAQKFEERLVALGWTVRRNGVSEWVGWRIKGHGGVGRALADRAAHH